MPNRIEKLEKRISQLEKHSRTLEEATKLSMRTIELLLSVHEPELLQELKREKENKQN